VWTSCAVRRIAGRGRLEGVEVADVRTGAVRFVPCETVVFTGDWIPDHELARRAGLAMDPGTRGPAADTTLATSAPGVFAAGNLVHAAETADIAALSGRHAARHMAAFLAGEPARGAAPGAASGVAGAGLPVLVEPPLRWISPNAVRLPAAPPPLSRFVLRSQDFRLARLDVLQDGRLLHRSRPIRLIPERIVHLDAVWLPRVDASGGPVRVVASRLAGGRRNLRVWLHPA
jgi:hypothetical protein